jgi:hypothetical protein
MSTLFYVVCIVAIVFTADTIQKYLKVKNEKKEGQDPELEETLAQIERLEERIKVLERIVTENKYDLSREISNLKCLCLLLLAITYFDPCTFEPVR